MNNKSIIIVFFFSSILLTIKGQSKDSLNNNKNIFSWFKNMYSDINLEQNRPKFLMYPTLALTPETSWEFGVTKLFLFYAKNDIENRLSEANSFTFYTLNKQFGIFLEHVIYTNNDNWLLIGKFKAQRFPLLYYGIGPDTKKSNEQLIASDQIFIREKILRKISNNFFGGLQIDYQKVSNINVEKQVGEINLIPGIKGTNNFGLGLALVYDTRKNPLNVRDGIYAEISTFNYGNFIKSDNKFNNISFDFRHFISLKPNTVLASQIIGQFIMNDPPFNLFSLLGNENIMRGYYTGRYRDKNLLAAQIEYRILPFDFSKRIGAVSYLSLGTVSPTIKDISLNNFIPTGGVGLRYLVFPKKDIFVRLDYGITREGNAFYIFLGEAF